MREHAQFDNIADALKAKGIDYWDPRAHSPGLKLVERVQFAIADCHLCIFAATSKSIESIWCTAETAAFWGKGAPVLVYGAEPSLDHSRLPPHLAGNYVEQRLSKLVEAVGGHRDALGKGLVDSSAHSADTTQNSPPLSTALIIEMLREKLTTATAELERVQLALADRERQLPGSSHSGMEGFEMTCADHVHCLKDAIARLEATQSFPWTLR